jgi:hypothetical protein
VRQGLDLCHFPVKRGLYRAWVQKCDFKSVNFCSHTRFGLKPYPIQQRRGGGNSKELGAWACLLGNNAAFLEILEIRFLATTWVSGVLQFALRACPVKYYGLECWRWAVVGSDSRN